MVKIRKPFNVHYILQIPTYRKNLGVDVKTYENATDPDLFCSVHSYGGTEKVENGVYGVLDTKVVQTYYRPDIVPSARLLDDVGQSWDIINPPENLDERGRFVQFKIKRATGGA